MKLITCFIVSCFCITLLTHQQPDETVLPQDNLPATDLKAPLPKGLSENPRVPADNLLTEQKVALGRKLFFDPVLSEDGTRSCASSINLTMGLPVLILLRLEFMVVEGHVMHRRC